MHIRAEKVGEMGRTEVGEPDGPASVMPGTFLFLCHKRVTYRHLMRIYTGYRSFHIKGPSKSGQHVSI